MCYVCVRKKLLFGNKKIVRTYFIALCFSLIVCLLNSRLVDTADSLFDTLHSTIMYYSTWNHLKELVLVPYRRTPRTNLKSTVFKSKAGTTTILISSMDDKKTKKKSGSVSTTASNTSPSKTSSTGSSSVTGQTGKTGSSNSADTLKEAVVKKQFHRPKDGGSQPNENSQTGSTTAKAKSTIIEEVSHAKEVDEYLMNEVYFTQSKTPRDRKTPSVAFSVGQIVRHKTDNYVGVVIGWDEVAKVNNNGANRVRKREVDSRKRRVLVRSEIFFHPHRLLKNGSDVTTETER